MTELRERQRISLSVIRSGVEGPLDEPESLAGNVEAARALVDLGRVEAPALSSRTSSASPFAIVREDAYEPVPVGGVGQALVPLGLVRSSSRAWSGFERGVEREVAVLDGIDEGLLQGEGALVLARAIGVEARLGEEVGQAPADAADVEGRGLPREFGLEALETRERRVAA